MSKELEALERIGKLETIVGLRVVPTKTIVKDFIEYHIIETALKDYERLKECIDERGKLINECIEIVAEKKLKALEIIKEKNVDVYHIKATYKVSEYNFWKSSTSKRLKKEEYELLKEVLL